MLCNKDWDGIPSRDRSVKFASAGDKDKLLSDQIRLQRYRQEYVRFSKAAGLRTQNERAQVAGFGVQQAAEAVAASNNAHEIADKVFPFDSNRNILLYLKEKPIVDIFAQNGIKYIQRISDKEIIVDAGKPMIVGSRQHAIDNLSFKADRAGMTVDVAQGFVNAAKLTLYQQDREPIKFMTDSGYAVLNLDRELVTAVPQKWRKNTISIFRRGDYEITR